MLAKKINYTDYKGNKREETFYFNLTKAEVTEMELGHNGGLSEKIKRIVDTQDGAEIITIFKDLITRSHGVISDDGKRFIKTEANKEEFLQSEAYSELFMELVTDSKSAAAFVNGVVPQEKAIQK